MASPTSAAGCTAAPSISAGASAKAPSRITTSCTADSPAAARCPRTATSSAICCSELQYDIENDGERQTDPLFTNPNWQMKSQAPPVQAGEPCSGAPHTL